MQPVPERGRHGIGLIDPGDREVDVMTPSTSDPLVAAEVKKIKATFLARSKYIHVSDLT